MKCRCEQDKLKVVGNYSLWSGMPADSISFTENTTDTLKNFRNDVARQVL